MSAIHSDDAYLDPRAELERLIVARTCEGCGEIIPCKVAYWPGTSQAPGQKQFFLPEREWYCFEQQRNGYVLKQWRYWLLCSACKCQGFAKWIFPVIQDLPTQVDFRELVNVQPMNAPVGQVFYMDFVEGAWLGDRHNPPREGQIPLP